MIPISDENHNRVVTPFINYLLILANIYVFIRYQFLGLNLEFTYAFATIPAEILTGKDIVTASAIVTEPLTGQQIQIPGLQTTPIPVWLTLITSTFMHGGMAHIFGNMLYLVVFGDNIENRIGHLHYLFFYLLCGVLASLSHVAATLFLGQNMLVPCIGASGAISGVLGAYLILYPRNRVRVWFFPFLIPVPAVLLLGFWIVFQILSGLGILGGGETGVAYAAHIGGFIAGLLLIKFFPKSSAYKRAEIDRNLKY